MLIYAAYALGGVCESFNPMTGFGYGYGMDHNTLDENALLNEFSINRTPLDRNKNNYYEGNFKNKNRRGKGKNNNNNLYPHRNPNN